MCDCCGTNFPDIALFCVMETVIDNSSKSMANIPVSFYTEFSHSVKWQNGLRYLKKKHENFGKNVKFLEKQSKCFLICFTIAKATFFC